VAMIFTSMVKFSQTCVKEELHIIKKQYQNVIIPTQTQFTIVLLPDLYLSSGNF